MSNNKQTTKTAFRARCRVALIGFASSSNGAVHVKVPDATYLLSSISWAGLHQRGRAWGTELSRVLVEDEIGANSVRWLCEQGMIIIDDLAEGRKFCIREDDLAGLQPGQRGTPRGLDLGYCVGVGQRHAPRETVGPHTQVCQALRIGPGQQRVDTGAWTPHVPREQGQVGDRRHPCPADVAARGSGGVDDRGCAGPPENLGGSAQSPGIHADLHEKLPDRASYYHQPVVLNISGFSVDEYGECCALADGHAEIIGRGEPDEEGQTYEIRVEPRHRDSLVQRFAGRIEAA